MSTNNGPEFNTPDHNEPALKAVEAVSTGFDMLTVHSLLQDSGHQIKSRHPELTWADAEAVGYQSVRLVTHTLNLTHAIARATEEQLLTFKPAQMRENVEIYVAETPDLEVKAGKMHRGSQIGTALTQIEANTIWVTCKDTGKVMRMSHGARSMQVSGRLVDNTHTLSLMVWPEDQGEGFGIDLKTEQTEEGHIKQVVNLPYSHGIVDKPQNTVDALLAATNMYEEATRHFSAQ